MSKVTITYNISFLKTEIHCFMPAVTILLYVQRPTLCQHNDYGYVTNATY